MYTLTDSEMEPIQNSHLYQHYFHALRKGLYHRTTLKGYLGIREQGFIHPNRGEFEHTYPQSTGSYAFNNSFIALFDFESTTEEKYLFKWGDWQHFFLDRAPVTIIFKLDRQQLDQKLIPASAAPDSNSFGDGTFRIPYVEAWYPESIPLTAVQKFILTFRSTEKCQTYDLGQRAAFDETIDLISTIDLAVLEVLREALGKPDEETEDLRCRVVTAFYCSMMQKNIKHLDMSVLKTMVREMLDR